MAKGVEFEAVIKEKKERITCDECMTGRLVIEYTPDSRLRKELVDVFESGTTVVIRMMRSE